MLNKKNILVGISGSVACVKIDKVLKLLEETQQFNIKVVMTQASLHFVKDEIQREFKDIEFFFDKDEFELWKKMGDPVLHIELRKWADVFVICPLSANTMAKFSNGICDNLISCVFRAWDFTTEQNNLKKPIIVAPAMNTCMYENPITKKQINQLKEMKVTVLDTLFKTLACGDQGLGAMQEPLVIVQMCVDQITKAQI